MSRHLIGLISDTHGLVRPECAKALAGVELILHAGDVGQVRPKDGRPTAPPGVLERLSQIAPVHAVRGNVDAADDPALVDHLSLRFGPIRVHVSHGHELGSPTPGRLLTRYDAEIIVFGHTHRAIVHREGGRLVVNPGAAGPARFDLKPSVARMTIEDGRVGVEIVLLNEISTRITGIRG